MGDMIGIKGNAGNGKTGKVCFRKGERLVATVKRIGVEGVYVDYPGVNIGSISARCWGTNVGQREALLARIAPGDRMDVEVVGWYPENGTLSLVPAGTNRPSPRRGNAGKTADGKRRAAKVAAPGRPAPKPALSGKPKFHPIPAGSVLLVDFANVLGHVEPKYAVDLLEGIERDLPDAGYGVQFFIEHRTMVWALGKQSDKADKGRLEELLSRKERVTIVYGAKAKADLPILQVASMMPNAVCVSCDRFGDYAETFPEIVGTDRVRPFSIVYLGGQPVLCVDGLPMPVAARRNESTSVAADPEPASGLSLEEPEGADPEPASVLSPDEGDTPAGYTEDGAEDPVFPGAVPEAEEPVRRAGGEGSGSAGTDREPALRRLKRGAKGDPETYFALAELLAQGTEGERKLAARYERLGRKRAKAVRESLARDVRRFAQMRRMGFTGAPHLSASRCRVARVSAFASIRDAGSPRVGNVPGMSVA